MKLQLVRIDADAAKIAKIHAAKAGITMAEWLSELIRKAAK